MVDTTTEDKEPSEATVALAMKVAAEMQEELESGQIEIVAQGKFLVFRIREQGSFRSGEAEVQGSFRPVLGKIKNILKDTEGRITVAGHTDNRPIRTRRFPSNWELSSARAAAVARELLVDDEIEQQRVRIVGHGSNIPVKENNTRDNRAYNRRVEIIITQGEEVVGSEIGITNDSSN
jgi:chemotaxis protein MotB